MAHYPFVRPTPGTAYRAFDYLTSNPSIPQGMYREDAAGPRFLAGLDGHMYYAPLKQMRLPVQGLSDPVTDILGGTIDKGIETVIIRSMPIIKQHLEPEIRPIRIMATATLIIATLAAATSVYTAIKLK